MGEPVRVETADQWTHAQVRLAALEQRFRAGPGDPVATRALAREIVRLRLALTSYSIRHQVRDAHDEQLAAGRDTVLEPF